MIQIYWNIVDKLPGREVGFLSPIEEFRLSQMRFARRRQSFLLGRWAGKQLLRLHPECAHLPASSITIANRTEGGPYVQIGEQELDVCISLSHRENEAVSALVHQPGVTIGVDLELVEEREQGLINDFFTPQESDQINLFPLEERSLAVTLFWSAKEAVLKALGKGLRVDSRKVNIEQAQDSFRDDGWQALTASGPELENCVCRLWWRRWGQFVLTLAIVSEKSFSNGFDSIAIDRI